MAQVMENGERPGNAISPPGINAKHKTRQGPHPHSKFANSPGFPKPSAAGDRNLPALRWQSLLRACICIATSRKQYDKHSVGPTGDYRGTADGRFRRRMRLGSQKRLPEPIHNSRSHGKVAVEQCEACGGCVFHAPLSQMPRAFFWLPPNRRWRRGLGAANVALGGVRRKVGKTSAYSTPNTSFPVSRSLREDQFADGSFAGRRYGSSSPSSGKLFPLLLQAAPYTCRPMDGPHGRCPWRPLPTVSRRFFSYLILSRS